MTSLNNKKNNRLTAIVIAKNETRNIADCLSALEFCGDRVVVDTGSSDDTAHLARNNGARVFEKAGLGYAEAKQFATDQCTSEWILWIDADERVPADLADEILQVIEKKTEFVAYRLARRAFFLGRWMKHGGWYPGYVTRLFKRNAGRFDTARVHESLIIDGAVGTLKNDLDHYTDDSIHHYFYKFNKYTSLAAEDLTDKGRKAGVADLLFRPGIMFFKMYVMKLGLLDGIEGFLLAVFSSCYVLTKYAKLWEKKHVKVSDQIPPPEPG